MWRWACAVALLCAALTHAAELKRAEKADTPFVLSSRYGRSVPRVMSPRNDRFFMSSRYGKRSNLPDLSALLRTADSWRHQCDCRPYRAALLALKTHYTKRPETSRMYHED